MTYARLIQKTRGAGKQPAERGPHEDQMLAVPDAWVTFAGHYLDALDRTVIGDSARDQPWRSGDFVREQRTSDLAEWHTILLPRLADTEAEDLLDRLVGHRALGGPELDFLRARLAHQQSDDAAARALITAALDRLPAIRRCWTLR